MNFVESQRPLDTMALQAFIDPSEWYTFGEKVQSIAETFPDITGVLAIGSLVQTFRPPTSFNDISRNGPLGLAYESIRNPQRRKVFPHNSSDLDLWVCVKDNKLSEEAERKVSVGGIALLEELASGTIERGTHHWYNKKEATFGRYYKQPDLYVPGFVSGNNGAPWMAEDFKKLLENALLEHTPDFVERISRFTGKTIPGNFLEVRAYPESLFNLRPDDVVMQNGAKDRQPFPRIADTQWISPGHASFVLYKTDSATIYPFQSQGRILGEDIDQHIASSEDRERQKSYGGMLIKPDAIENGQVAIIKNKIVEGIKKFNGRIVQEKYFPELSPKQVREIYPLLQGQELEEAVDYLSNGSSIALVIESDLDEGELMKAINAIKGPRVGDRTKERLLEGRVEDGSIRDLLPLPGDEKQYKGLIPSVLKRQSDPSHRFTPTEYEYYSRNLVHTPDNSVELNGLLSVMGLEL